MEFVGTSTFARTFKPWLDNMARHNVTVMLIGETGTGKDWACRYMHHQSGNNKPLTMVHCAQSSEGLVEDDLFGHEVGAFTDAKGRRAGCFEAASGGWLVLNELQDVKKTIQAKLLRGIEEKVIRRLGSTTDVKVDTRIIAVCNKDPDALISSGEFRADFFYRISTFPFRLTPLRERQEDIVPLATHIARDEFKFDLELDSEERYALMTNPWPGNVRQLQGMIHQRLILGKNANVFQAHLTNNATQYDHILDGLKLALAANQRSYPDIEKNMEEILARVVLEEYLRHGNETKAATALNMEVRSLRHHKDKWGLPYLTQIFGHGVHHGYVKRKYSLEEAYEIARYGYEAFLRNHPQQ